MKNPKKMAFVMILLGCMSTAYAQKNVSLNLANAPLSQVIKEVESKTDYTFFINDTRVDVNTRVSVIANNTPIDQALKDIFAVTDYTYEIIDKQILVKLKSSTPAQQGRKVITGIVKDTQGETMIGVSIRVDGAITAVSTDVDGRYTIAVPNNDAILTFTYLGFESQSISVRDRDVINVTLSEDSKILSEVVVIGYGTQQKKTLTGAISVVNFDNIEATGFVSVSHGLAGKAAGLRVNQISAQPGGGVSLKIRGEAAGGAGSDPLIVIDGFPVGSTGGNMDTGLEAGFGQMGNVDHILSSLNPDDIESISVLKDAASTAIYGARAGHGVILITTKRGSDRKAQVSYSGQASVQTMSNKFQMLGVREFMDMRNRQYYENYLANNGMGIYADYIQPNNNPPPFVPHYTNDQILRAKETDWLDLVTRTGFMQQHNVQVVGGSNRSRYLVSLNYMNQAGIIENNDMRRISGRINFDQDFGKYVTAGLTMTYSQNKFDNVPLGSHPGEYSGIIASAVRANPANPVYDENGNYYLDPSRSFAPNPVSLLDYKDLSVYDRLLANGYITLKPIEGMEVKGGLGIDRRFQKRSSYIPKTTVEGQRNNGSARISESDASDYLLDLNITYSKEFNGHKLKGLLGYSYQQYNSEGLVGSSRDFLTDAFLYHNLGAGASERQTAGSSASKRSIASYFGRVNYNYKDRYLVEASVRADGSSNFVPENRWGYFPSASLGWVFSEEDFMKSAQSWLSNGKLRLSYGATGNENVGYGLQNTYSIDWKNFIFGDAEHKGAFVSALGNKDVTWETTTEFNIGLDLGFLDRRIQVTVEYFNRQVSDMLQWSKPIPSYNEVTSIVANAGKVESQGYELTLNTVNIANKAWNWNTTLTLSHYNDKWKERPAFIAMKPYQSHTDPFNAWWTYEAVGIMRPGDPVPDAQKDLLPGMVILKDQNDDDVIDDEDMVYQGNGAPKVYFGLNNEVKYKNFDFSIYFYGEIGQAKGTSYLEQWTFMETNQVVNVSARANQSFNSANLNSNHPTFLKQGTYGWGDYYVKNIYYIRCGSITLGYTIPIKKTIVQNVRVYANVNNPFVITNWSGLDPETDNGDFPYPNIRSFGMGVNITF
jgi:TonB-linked SusC/RagA family outer membrane protein